MYVCIYIYMCMCVYVFSHNSCVNLSNQFPPYITIYILNCTHVRAYVKKTCMFLTYINTFVTHVFTSSLYTNILLFMLNSQALFRTQERLDIILKKLDESLSLKQSYGPLRPKEPPWRHWEIMAAKALATR